MKTLLRQAVTQRSSTAAYIQQGAQARLQKLA
jgi:hypothetical protein